jgi:uncharacterized protein YcbK (DUF882 family)
MMVANQSSNRHISVTHVAVQLGMNWRQSGVGGEKRLCDLLLEKTVYCQLRSHTPLSVTSSMRHPVTVTKLREATRGAKSEELA